MSLLTIETFKHGRRYRAILSPGFEGQPEEADYDISLLGDQEMDPRITVLNCDKGGPSRQLTLLSFSASRVHLNSLTPGPLLIFKWHYFNVCHHFIPSYDFDFLGFILEELS